MPCGTRNCDAGAAGTCSAPCMHLAHPVHPVHPGGSSGLLAVRAPVTKILSGGAVEHDDASVAVAVCDEHFVVGGIHPDLRRTTHQRSVVTAARLIELADHHDNFASPAELDREVALARVGPDKAVVIHEQAVDRVPLAVRAARIPRLQLLALLIPFGDSSAARRPDVALRVREDPDHLSPCEIGGRRRPLRIGRELRHSLERSRLLRGE